MIVVCDIETNRLENPDVVWCIVCKELANGTVRTFIGPGANGDASDYSGFIEYAKTVTQWIMHNGIGFDALHLSRLVTNIASDRVIDTLILSRLINYRIDGGHSLDSWGARLGYRKGNFTQFDHYSPEMLEYCIRDVELTYKFWKEVLEPYWEQPSWRPSMELELKCACLAEDMSSEGFPFDQARALKLKTEFEETLAKLDKDILNAFPPKSVLLREINPKSTKHGTIHKGDFRWLPSVDGAVDLTPYSPDCPFSLIEFEPFNPGSVKQIVERMNAAGWQPHEKTKKHVEVERALKTTRDRTARAALAASLEQLRKTGWKVSETNLETLPQDAPEAARTLSQRLILARRLSTLEEWLAAYRPETRRVHGSFLTIGCWTHRFSHQAPNFANIIANDKPYGPAMRGLWRAEADQLLVDVDAKGIQLRILAHYINDPTFTEALVSGNEDDLTDIHNLNKKALGDVCTTRKKAKTFIYSWLLGAGAGMTAKVLGCSLSEAKQARDNFENFYPGLRNLKQSVIPADARQGYFTGFDGRKVLCDSEHHMLSGYLQNGEAVVMKTAWRIANEDIKRKGLPGAFINFVHDEFAYLCPRISTVADEVRHTLCEAIRRAGELLNLNCPMAGNGHIGSNWSEVH